MADGLLLLRLAEFRKPAIMMIRYDGFNGLSVKGGLWIAPALNSGESSYELARAS